MQSYVWRVRNVSAGVPWIRLVAALLLATVADALMRAARAAAHLMLLSYRLPVKRKVCHSSCAAINNVYMLLKLGVCSGVSDWASS